LSYQDTGRCGHPAQRRRSTTREITAAGDGTSLAASDAPTGSVSQRLTRYPQDLLRSPLNQRAVRLEFRPGGARLAGSGPATAGRAGRLDAVPDPSRLSGHDAIPWQRQALRSGVAACQRLPREPWDSRSTTMAAFGHGLVTGVGGDRADRQPSTSQGLVLELQTAAEGRGSACHACSNPLVASIGRASCSRRASMGAGVGEELAAAANERGSLVAEAGRGSGATLAGQPHIMWRSSHCLW